jgi:ribosomal protein S18 acetylase RimI-like enzyme
VLTWTLRPAGADDTALLLRVYAETRRDELASTGWPAEQRQAFLRMQFAAQDSHYRQYFAAAHFDIVEAWGSDVGRFYVDRADDEIRVLDIALLPEYRGRGLGGALLRAVLAEAGASGRRVALHVERNNPAAALYQRLGFVVVDHQGIYQQMHWTAPLPSPAAGHAALESPPVAA